MSRDCQTQHLLPSALPYAISNKYFFSPISMETRSIIHPIALYCFLRYFINPFIPYNPLNYSSLPKNKKCQNQRNSPFSGSGTFLHRNHPLLIDSHGLFIPFQIWNLRRAAKFQRVHRPVPVRINGCRPCGRFNTIMFFLRQLNIE